MGVPPKKRSMTTRYNRRPLPHESNTAMSPLPHPANDAIAGEFEITIALLEAIAADRTLLERLSPEQRERLHQAVAKVYHPDPVLRRQRIKAAERARSIAQIAREESLLNA